MVAVLQFKGQCSDRECRSAQCLFLTGSLCASSQTFVDVSENCHLASLKLACMLVAFHCFSGEVP